MKKRVKGLSEWATNRIANGKRLTKFDMAYELYRCFPIEYTPVYNYLDAWKRADVLSFFNNEFNTDAL